jgi:hypothetical protein
MAAKSLGWYYSSPSGQFPSNFTLFKWHGLVQSVPGIHSTGGGGVVSEPPHVNEGKT